MTDVRQDHRRSWFAWNELRRDLRAAAVDAGAALVITLVLFVWLYQRIDSGTSATIEVMPTLAGTAGTKWLYWLCQAFGWTALLWAWITVMLGLIRSSRRPRWLPVGLARLERWHRTTSLTTIVLMFAHAFCFFLEEIRDNEESLAWAGRTWHAFARVFVPGVYPSGTGVVAVLIGLLAFYLALPIGLAYYSRRSLHPRVWRALHGSVIVVYVLSVWHTLLYGTNVWYDGWFRTTVWLLQLPVAALLLIRLLTPSRRPRHGGLEALGRWTAKVSVAGTLVAILFVVATGRDGGRTRGVDGAGLNVTPGMIWCGLVAMLVVVGVALHRAHRHTATNPGD